MKWFMGGAAAATIFASVRKYLQDQCGIAKCIEKSTPQRTRIVTLIVKRKPQTASRPQKTRPAYAERGAFLCVRCAGDQPPGIT
jgi:hypothetical protein